MIAGNFLRRIEPNPSPDLADRQDLLLFQVEKPLNVLEWLDLLVSPPDYDYIYMFDSMVESIKEHPDSFVNIHSRIITGYNSKVFRLCLFNRVRKELGLPLLTLRETQWVNYITYLLFEEWEELEGMFRNGIR